jgi:2-keto-3-deoxy-galactonokinase
MSGASFVAGDWETTYLRLFLCDEDGVMIDSAGGPGVAAGNFEKVFDSLHLVGSPQLTELYAAGLRPRIYNITRTDGVPAAVAGLTHVRRQLTHGAVANAT